jgi:hypothetical protein
VFDKGSIQGANEIRDKNLDSGAPGKILTNQRRIGKPNVNSIADDSSSKATTRY